jgi:hypothetical protein
MVVFVTVGKAIFEVVLATFFYPYDVDVQFRFITIV